MNSNTKVIYCDMDGVLADFDAEPNAIVRFPVELGFFASLKPITKNVRAIKKLVKQGRAVKILTASPNHNADIDKMRWLSQYLPEIKKEDIIICRNGQNKADFATNITNSLLLDDYGKNIRQWREKGGVAIQIGKEVKHIGQLRHI